jgi:hypothetical protein
MRCLLTRSNSRASTISGDSLSVYLNSFSRATEKRALKLGGIWPAVSWMPKSRVSLCSTSEGMTTCRHFDPERRSLCDCRSSAGRSKTLPDSHRFAAPAYDNSVPDGPLSGVTKDVNAWLFPQALDSDGLRKRKSRSSFGRVPFPADSLVRSLSQMRRCKCVQTSSTGTVTSRIRITVRLYACQEPSVITPFAFLDVSR